MNIWSNITLTAVDSVYLVPSIQGKDCTIFNRKSYGLSFSYGGQISYHLNGRRYVSNKTNAILLPRGQTYFLKREETGDFPLINFLCAEDFDVSDFVVTPLRNPESYRKDWERMQFIVQFVDLDGDFKTDFILYARDMIMVVKPAKNGKWEYIAFADCVGKFVYLPFTIFGKPKVWRFKTENHDSGFVDWE